MTDTPRTIDSKHRIRTFLGWCALVATILGTLVLWTGGDAWWPTFLLLYTPRWIWLGAIFVIAMGWRHRRRMLLQLVVAVPLVAFGLMGVNIGTFRGAPADAGAIRVLTLNAEGHTDAIQRTLDLARREDVSMVAIQECPPMTRTTVTAPEGWEFRQVSELCFYSRYPVSGDLEIADRDETEMGYKGTIARAHVAGPSGPLVVGLVHLRSVHGPLQEFIDFSEFFKQGPYVRREAAKREAGTATAVQWFSQPENEATLILGDFNLPPESGFFRRYWLGWQDAFAVVGWGTGYTWHSRWHGLRIDHILVKRPAKVWRADVAPNVGSDHRPLLAEVTLPSVQRTSTTR